MRKSKKVYAVCQTPNCDNEFSFVPSRKQKYCSTACYQGDPEYKKKKRIVLQQFFLK